MRALYAAVLAASLLTAGCGDGDAPSGEATASESAGIPNPASEACQERGGREENREDADGGQRGVCVFDDGSECDSWALYRGECEPGATPAGQG